MDVARAFPDGLGQQRVHKPDDRCVIGCLEQVRGLVEFRREERQVLFLHLLHRVLGAVHVLAVQSIDGVEDHFGGGQTEGNICVEQDPEVVDRGKRKRFGGGYENAAVLAPERDRDRFFRIGDRQLEREFTIDLTEAGLERQAELRAERREHLGLGHEVETNEQCSDPASPLLLKVERLFEPFS